MSQLTDVRDFMVSANQTTANGLENPPTVALRIKLIEEEYDELIEAINWGDPALVAKELADLLYVVHGTAVAFGIPLDEVFQAVHRSNMTKITTHTGTGDVKVGKGPSYVDPMGEIKEILTMAVGKG
jgi:NTP pyrophosphatase (non-canonical NTP hydrolase)